MRQTVETLLRKLARFNGESGTCWDAESNLRRLNDVREIIYERGDYEGTMEFGCVKIEDGCIYLPSHLETVRIAWLSSKPVLIRGYNYMALDSIGIGSGCECIYDRRRAIQQTGSRRAVTFTPDYNFSIWIEREDDCDEVEMIFHGTDREGVSTKVVVDLSSDTGKPLSSERGTFFSDICEVVKPVTAGRIFVYGSEADEGDKQLMAVYQPEAVHPRFAEMTITNYCENDCDNDLVVLAKKTFYELTDHKQLVDIESTQALRFGYQALNAQSGNRDDEYGSKIRLMEEQLIQVDINMDSGEAAFEANPIYDTHIKRGDCNYASQVSC